MMCGAVAQLEEYLNGIQGVRGFESPQLHQSFQVLTSELCYATRQFSEELVPYWFQKTRGRGHCSTSQPHLFPCISLRRYFVKFDQFS